MQELNCCQESSLPSLVLACSNPIYNFTQRIGYSVPRILGLRRSQTFGVTSSNIHAYHRIILTGPEHFFAPICQGLKWTSQGLRMLGQQIFVHIGKKNQGAVILRITKNSCKSLPRQFETRNPSSARELLPFKLERSPTI